MSAHDDAVIGRGLRCGPSCPTYQNPIDTASSTGGGSSVTPSVALARMSAPSAALTAVTVTVACFVRGKCTTRSVQPSPRANRARSWATWDSRVTSTPGGSNVASSRTLVRLRVVANGWWPATNAVSRRASMTSRGESLSSIVRTTGSSVSGAVPATPSSRGNCCGIRIPSMIAVEAVAPKRFSVHHRRELRADRLQAAGRWAGRLDEVRVPADLDHDRLYARVGAVMLDGDVA